MNGERWRTEFWVERNIASLLLDTAYRYRYWFNSPSYSFMAYCSRSSPMSLSKPMPRVCRMIRYRNSAQLCSLPMQAWAPPQLLNVWRTICLPCFLAWPQLWRVRCVSALGSGAYQTRPKVSDSDLEVGLYYIVHSKAVWLVTRKSCAPTYNSKLQRKIDV